jgi:hypothetical protein
MAGALFARSQGFLVNVGIRKELAMGRMPVALNIDDRVFL